MKKILFVAAEFPSKLGALRGLYYHLKFFSRLFEVHYIRIRLDDKKDLGELGLPKGVKYSEIKGSGFALDPLLLVYPLYAKSAARMAAHADEVQRYIDENGIDAAYTFTHPCALAMRSLRANVKVAELVDAVPHYYSSKASCLKSLESRLIEKAVFFLCRIADNMLNNGYDLIAYVSKTELPYSFVSKDKTLISYMARDAPLEKKASSGRGVDVAIFGKWDHPPNRDGLSGILGRFGEINGKVFIIGPNLKRSGLPENVNTMGYVDDLPAFLSKTKICIVPVYYGAGLQTKVFDSLRSGCKVVSTGYTKQSFLANGFVLPSVSYPNDLIDGVNQALADYNPDDSKAAYADYEALYSASVENEVKFVKKVLDLCVNKGASKKSIKTKR